MRLVTRAIKSGSNFNPSAMYAIRAASIPSRVYSCVRLYIFCEQLIKISQTLSKTFNPFRGTTSLSVFVGKEKFFEIERSPSTASFLSRINYRASNRASMEIYLRRRLNKKVWSTTLSLTVERLRKFEKVSFRKLTATSDSIHVSRVPETTSSKSLTTFSFPRKPIHSTYPSIVTINLSLPPTPPSQLSARN